MAAAPAEAAAGEVIQLPVRRPPVSRTDPLELLGPSQPFELVSHAPGPVDDRETVRVGLGRDGAVRSVRVEQTLTVLGVGDFEMKVLGPVLDIEAPPEQSPQPGLRRQTVTWQGFSTGKDELRSTVTLVPTAEQDRLPMLVSVGADGTVTLRNNTTLPVTLAVGTAEPGALRSTYEAARTRLARGEAAVAGEDGLPAALVAQGPVGSEKVDVTVPVHVTGTVGDSAVDTVLGSSPMVVGRGPVRLRVTGALPTLVAGGGLRELQVALAQMARLVDLDAFVGVTVPGPSSSVYEYAPVVVPPPPPKPADPDADGVTIGWAAVALLALVAAGRSVWIRA